MTKYMISFPSGEMNIPEGEFEAVAEAAHEVIREAKAAGVYVFGGGIDEEIAPVLVDANGAAELGTYPQTRQIEGGYTILELPNYESALEWAAKIAAACRCRQELRAFMYDPES